MSFLQLVTSRHSSNRERPDPKDRTYLKAYHYMEDVSNAEDETMRCDLVIVERRCRSLHSRLAKAMFQRWQLPSTVDVICVAQSVERDSPFYIERYEVQKLLERLDLDRGITRLSTAECKEAHDFIASIWPAEPD